VPGVDIVEATFPATTFATIRKTVKFTEMDSFYSQSYEALGKAAGTAIKGNAHSIIYSWDETNGQGDMAAAFPVNAAVAGTTMVNIPESKGYMVKYTGPYSDFYAVHGQIAKYAAENGLTDPLVIEEYVAMPPQVTDTNKFVTHIYYLKK
jgi:effector-binding domain-containing protein